MTHGKLLLPNTQWLLMTNTIRMPVTPRKVWQMAQQFYISGGEALIGPVSPRDLRQMANDGSIQPDTQISLDGRKWIQASAIKELVFGPPVESDSGPSFADRFKSTVKKTANALGDVISGIASSAQATSR